MRRVKTVSIEKYLTHWLLMVVTALTIIFLVFINILSNVAIEYDIKEELYRATRNINRGLKWQDGTVQSEEEYSSGEENFLIMVLDHNGRIYGGDAPKELAKYSIGKDPDLRVIELDGTKYYMMDRMKMLYDENKKKGVVIRAIVAQDEIYSQYQIIRTLSYLTIPLLILVVIFSEVVFRRRITKPINQMCETAEVVGNGAAISQRMEYDGEFSEIAVLANANNRMMDQFEKMLENQQQFTSDVAHELRTPVAVMLAQCQFARENLDSREDLQGAIEVLERQSRKMNHIIGQLLKLSRLDQNRIQMELDYVNIGEIVQSICEDEQEKAGDKIHIQTEAREIYANIDIYLITILIHNLVNNAVKYSPEHSTITVTMEEDEQKIQVRVQDQGIGIRQENQKTIFSRFYRVEESRNEEGFGLGLPLAMKIAEKHGGTIFVESVYGQGSIFTFVLPKN